jgi:hypothetical protein
MKLYLLMYLFLAESSSDPLIVYLNELGKIFNKYFPYVNIFLILCLFVFIFGMFLFHNVYVITFASKLTKLVSKKFSYDLEMLANALNKKGDYKSYEWMKGLENGNYTGRKTFEAWMQNVFTQEYFNNVTAFAYFGASILIFIIGLRGIRIFITSETPMLVIFGIMLEFSMLILLAFTQFYTPENPEKEKGGEAPIEEELKKLRERLRSLEGRLSVAENSLEDAVKLVKDSRDLIDNTDQDIWTISKR